MKLILVLFLFISFLSHAEEYREYTRGRYTCTDAIETLFIQNPIDFDVQYFYYSCLVIKGQDDKGLPHLDLLSHNRRHLLASDFLANYYRTDGNLEGALTRVKLNEAIEYRMRTQAIINLMPSYPGPYKQIEQNTQIELVSAYQFPHLYFLKYNLGFIGDYNRHLLASSSYEGPRDLDTYPDYNNQMRLSLNSIVRYAGECANLPQKNHFNLKLYENTIKACRLMKETAENLITLEYKRQEILLQSNCQDLNKKNCPEYYKTHNDINKFVSLYMNNYIRLFEGFTL